MRLLDMYRFYTYLLEIPDVSRPQRPIFPFPCSFTHYATLG